MGFQVDWQQVSEVLLSKGLKIVLILLLSYVAYRAIRIAASSLAKAMDDEGVVRMDAREQHADTVLRLVRRSGAVIIGIIALLTILSELGISVAPLLTSAGILGVAVGLGTQNLVKDALAGFLILVEDQFAVGDYVTIAGISGTVEEMSLRRTSVRGFNGTLYVVPNSEIKVVSNGSKDWSRVVEDVGVAYEADLTRAMGLLEETAKEVVSAEEYRTIVLAPPSVMGVMALAESWVTLRVEIKVQPGTQWALGRALRKRIKERFEVEGIDLPYPQQVVHVRQ